MTKNQKLDISKFPHIKINNKIVLVDTMLEKSYGKKSKIIFLNDEINLTLFPEEIKEQLPEEVIAIFGSDILRNYDIKIKVGSNNVIFAKKLLDELKYSLDINFTNCLPYISIPIDEEKLKFIFSIGSFKNYIKNDYLKDKKIENTKTTYNFIIGEHQTNLHKFRLNLLDHKEKVKFADFDQVENNLFKQSNVSGIISHYAFKGKEIVYSPRRKKIYYQYISPYHKKRFLLSEIMKPIDEYTWLEEYTNNKLKFESELPLKELLENSLYYPCAHIDWTPLNFYKGYINSFVFCDIVWSLYHSTPQKIKANIYESNSYNYECSETRKWIDENENENINRTYIRNYRMIFERKLTSKDLGFQNYVPTIKPTKEYGNLETLRKSEEELRGKEEYYWFLFEKINKNIEGPKILSLLYIFGEMSAVYDALYVKNKIKPRVLHLQQPGPTWDNRKYFTEVIKQNKKGWPKYLYTNVDFREGNYKETKLEYFYVKKEEK